eukprot:gene14100-14218_t
MTTEIQSDISIDADINPTIRQLFTSFLILGLTGFGGVLPLAKHMIVEQKGWLDTEEFVDLLGLCQFLPGGNIINIATALGLKFRGPLGAIAALVGLIAAPSMVVIILGVIYDRFENEPHVRHVFIGLAAAAAGLLVAMAVKVAMQLRGKPVAIAIATICFVAVAWLRLPLIPTMLVLLPVSMLAARKLAA